MNAKDIAKKTWNLIWHDESVLGWIVGALFFFVLVKFVFYPCIGMVLHAHPPFVAVMSGSMEHDGNFEEWWTSPGQKEYYTALDIEKAEFQNFKFENGFNTGDLMVLYGTAPDKIKIGDVIVFSAGREEPIIHRVVFVGVIDGHYAFTTKGDHNQGSFDFEIDINESNYMARAVMRVPYAGYVKIGFTKLIGVFK